MRLYLSLTDRWDREIGIAGCGASSGSVASNRRVDDGAAIASRENDEERG